MEGMNPFLATDGYKTGHHLMYPEDTTLVYSNFTPRHGKHSNTNLEGVISFGQQMVMKQIKEMFDNDFFGWNLPGKSARIVEGTHKTTHNLSLKKYICGEIKEEYSTYLGTDYDVSHIEALWDLGYLPIKVKALPEGTFVPYGVPVLTVYNTKPEFYWLTNFLETLISNLLWKPMTSATTAYAYKKLLVEAATKTDKENLGFVEFQGHDFSMRGLSGLEDAVSSGLGHATSFLGSDSLPVIHGARKYYGEKGGVVHSVNATEHSVMCAGTKDDEIGTFRHLMKQFPTGILSVVSDTWDLWKVITDYLPQLKEEILKRDGKIVIRPDSGNPVDIICGTEFELVYDENEADEYHEELFKHQISNEGKGVIELLWDIFGGTINEQGYKVLDPHIGAIYGDSITLDRAKQITERLEAKGFASTNVVLGIGSYTYQYVTRDTHGLACKATYVELTKVDQKATEERNEEMQTIGGPCGYPVFKTVGREIFKDPVTDDGGKKSAKGLLYVQPQEVSESGNYELSDQQDWKSENAGALQTIFKDGKFYNKTTLTEIRERLK